MKTEADLIEAVSRAKEVIEKLIQQLETYREFCVCNPQFMNEIVSEIYDLIHGIEGEVKTLYLLQLGKMHIDSREV